MKNVRFDNKLFIDIVNELSLRGNKKNGIGTYKEEIIHASMKIYIDPDTSHHEKKHMGYIADIINGNGIIEIQTGSFGKMKEKLAAFRSDGQKITIVYPAVRNRTIISISQETGEIISKRRSPKHGSRYSILPELIYIRQFILDPGINYCIFLIDIDDYRTVEAGVSNSKRKSAVHKYKAVPSELIDIFYVSSFKDFIPDALSEIDFTIRDYARITGMNYKNAQKALTVLRCSGTVIEIGKKGKQKLFCES